MNTVTNEVIYSSDTKMIFMKNDEGNYEPIIYNCYEDIEGNINGTKVEKGDIYSTFIGYVRFYSENVDKNTGKKLPGFLEIYQWKIAFDVITCAMKLKSEDYLAAVSRQAKYNWLV